TAAIRRNAVPSELTSAELKLRATGEYGHDSEDRQRAQISEVQDPAAQPMPSVRTAARVHAQVRPLPAVLPQAGARRRHHGCDQEQLVNTVAVSYQPRADR